MMLKRFLSLILSIFRVFFVSRGGRFALSYAIRNNHLRLLGRLTRNKVHEHRILFVEDPLSLACRTGRTSVIRHLLSEGGMRPSARAVEFAADIGNTEAVALLVAAMRENPTFLEGQRTEILGRGLIAASRAGHAHICRLLLDNGAPVDFRLGGPMGTTSLLSAVIRGDLDVTKELIDHGADVDTPGVNGASPVTSAVEQCDLGFLKVLLDARVAGLKEDESRLLALAEECHCTEIVAFLQDRDKHSTS